MRLQYGIGKLDGGVMSFCRIGQQFVCPVLDYEGMKPENNFKIEYFLEKLEGHSNYYDFHWTKKIPVKLKNLHRKMWGMKPLKETPIKFPQKQRSRQWYFYHFSLGLFVGAIEFKCLIGFDDLQAMITEGLIGPFPEETEFWPRILR